MKISILLILILSFYSFSGFSKVKFIINKKNINAELTVDSLKKIFSGELTSWDKGFEQIQVVDYKRKTKEKRKFCSDFLNISSSRLYKKWIRASLEGNGESVILLPNEKEIIDYIETHPNAIGYLYSKEITSKKLKKVIIK